MASPLLDRMRPCGPVVDPQAADRVRQRLAAAKVEDWEGIESAWPVLAPVVAASPYLAGLATRDPARLARLLAEAPEDGAERILSATRDPAGAGTGAHLRRLKAELHLLTALADLGGVWPLETVTRHLSRFAGRAAAAALAEIARQGRQEGWLTQQPAANSPLDGLFVIAMGKLGAFELNYSSDIDISVFYEPDALPAAHGTEAARAAQRIVERLAEMLQGRTAEGYVFRVDMRLRPDPLSTPPAAPVPGALIYYQSVGQNWERAAFIKARVLAGDLDAGERFLGELSSFVWRRNLDFAAIEDIQSIKRQIHVFKTGDPREAGGLIAAGADLKLGRGGIREIEFYVQTLQLIHGGRDPALRARGTLEALDALVRAGRVKAEAAADLRAAYRHLRGLEHRAQMIDDEQTHRLPERDAERRRIAALDGFHTLRAFDALVSRTLRKVNRRYGELFAETESLSSVHGSLVFTGVEDDPGTLATLTRLGFHDPVRVSREIRAWHHGRIRATRSARERELLTRLAPRLLEAVSETGASDVAFLRFTDFFSGLASSVQLQSLLLAHPALLDLLVQVLAFAPRFARTLARQPAVVDALLDPDFFAGIEAAENPADRLSAAGSFEAALDEARRLHAERAFRIGVQLLSRRAGPRQAGAAFADLADALIGALCGAALAEVERQAGSLQGEVAVVAMGGCGAREMTARSDLDLMTLYGAAPGATSTGRGWSAETWFARFTQRLIAALSALTPAGGLYKVDMQLRPSGSAGPVAVSRAAFEAYYEREAETWELLALTKARVVWASTPAARAWAAAAIEAALRQPRDAAAGAADVREMRALIAAERPARHAFDMKLSAGGLTDIDFCAQHLQLALAGAGGPLRQNTGEALAALAAYRSDLAAPLADLQAAWRLQSDLAQLVRLALDDETDPAGEPEGLRRLLVRAGGARSFPGLLRRIERARARVRAIFEDVVR